MLRAFLNNDVLKGSAGTLAIKLSASILGFAMFAMAARQMDPHDFGRLAVLFNTMAFLAAVALCGQETLIVRSWDEYGRSGRPSLARGALAFGAKVSFGAALLVAMATGIIWRQFDHDVSLGLILSACAFLLLFSLLQFIGQFARVAANVLVAEIPRELVWRLIVVMAIGLFHLSAIQLGATEFFLGAVAGIVVALGLHAVIVTRSVPESVKHAAPQNDVRAWTQRSFRMWTAATLDNTSQYLEVVLISFLLGPAAAAFYFVATRITNVFAMITGSVSIYATSRISALYYSNAKPELQAMLRMLAIVAATLSGATLLVIVLVGSLLLSLFGEVYASAYPVLIVLAAGAAIGALVGPAMHVLLLTGHEGIYPRIMASVLFARAILMTTLAPAFGLMGVAAGWTISAVILVVSLIVACRRLVGLDPSLSFLAWPPDTSPGALKATRPHPTASRS